MALSLKELQEIKVAAAPTPGLGLALDTNGRIPLSVRMNLSGYVFGYAQIVAGVTLASAVEATPTTVVTAPEIKFDGSTTVYIEVYVPQLNSPGAAAGNVSALAIFEGTTEIGRVANIQCSVAGVAFATPVYGSFRITPTAGPHTYLLAGYSTGGTGAIVCGAGGAATHSPAFIRVVRE